MFDEIDQQTKLVLDFLALRGWWIKLFFSSPAVTDRKAQQYGNEQDIEYRYLANRTVTVYARILMSSERRSMKLGVR